MSIIWNKGKYLTSYKDRSLFIFGNHNLQYFFISDFQAFSCQGAYIANRLISRIADQPFSPVNANSLA